MSNDKNMSDYVAMSYEPVYFWQIPNVSFQYLNFSGWNINKIEKQDENKYVIYLDYPKGLKLEYPPTIIVEKHGSGDPRVDAIKNPNGVYYVYNKTIGEPERIFFYGPSPYGISLTPFLHEGNGYSGELMVKEIIDSFRLVD